ncbi:MAG TPA: hypothetical protein DHV26_09225 [Cytophagales bacterium]|nr:hypothetical protein [Cytophagales bacterium]HRG07681.1 hypothetical protein [Cyclobacteriaceae bacterium]
MIAVKPIKTLLLALAMIFVMGCERNPEVIDDTEEIPEGWKSLDEIVGNPAYPSLQLTGIRWKLIGFADEGKNIIRPIASSTYIISFRVDGLIDTTQIPSGKYLLMIKGETTETLLVVKHQ